MEKNHKKIGMVINLDEHWKRGSHWVGLYANIDKSQIYFFDSYVAMLCFYYKVNYLDNALSQKKGISMDW